MTSDDSRSKSRRTSLTSQSEKTGTSIDLGEDLLEKTRTKESSSIDESVDDDDNAYAAKSPISVGESTDDLIQSAQILLREGLAEEAKRILHQVLRKDPANVTARNLLGQIHEQELKQIFYDEPVRRQKKSVLDGDHEKVLQELDRDLKLGILNLEDQPSLFKDSAGIDSFAEKIEESYINASPRDRMDLGIAFLEMGVFELAVRQFRAAQRSSSDTLAATALLAYALILNGKAFEASLTLEAVLGDISLELNQKIEFFYLMGRANESLNRIKLATEWYQDVLNIDPTYRDTEERIRRCNQLTVGG